MVIPGASRLLAGLALALFTVPAPAQWGVAVGGNSSRDSSSAEVGPTADTILWQGSRSAIVAQQGAMEGDLLVVNRIQSFTIPTGTWIVAHDRNTGAVQWETQLPMDFPDSWRSRMTGVRDGRVYATRAGNTNADYLYALDAADGSILWQSDDLVTETTTESVAFAPDGDLITTGKNTGGQTVLMRIESTDGSTVWATPRTCPTSGGCDAALTADRAYIWEADASGPKITAFDLATGARLYSSASIGAGFIQQVSPFVGPDGTVYAPRSVNNPTTDFLVALEDTGSGFNQKWSVPIGYIPFASHAIGPDGSVYTISRNMEILRVDPSNGAILDDSLPIPHDFPMQPRMAIDASGKLYFTNGSFGSGELFVFTPDLRELWSTPITNVNVGGPILGDDGTLVVCGVGTDLRAYRTACEGYWLAYGDACAGSGGFEPSLAGTGCPTPGQSVTLEIRDALGGTFGMLFFGLDTDLVPITDVCDLQIGPLSPLRLLVALPGVGPGDGDVDLIGTIPVSTPSGDVFLQMLVFDGGAPDGIAATQPIQLHIE